MENTWWPVDHLPQKKDRRVFTTIKAPAISSALSLSQAEQMMSPDKTVAKEAMNQKSKKCMLVKVATCQDATTNIDTVLLWRIEVNNTDRSFKTGCSKVASRTSDGWDTKWIDKVVQGIEEMLGMSRFDECDEEVVR